MASNTGDNAFDIDRHQHIRYNPLRNEWVIVSPHRLLRPWSGQMEKKSTKADITEFDPNNPLCPGVSRPCGKNNPNYKSTYVFNNDYPALMEEGPECPSSDDPLFQCKTAKGICRVMCFHPKTNVYISTMTIDEIIAVINEWINQINDLGQKYIWVQIFENRGELMGCSNPHPHCQIWASNFFPNEPKLKHENLLAYYQTYKRPLLQDYLKKELAKKDRIVFETSEWVVLVPYWAAWPFETMLLPKKQIKRFTDCSGDQKRDLAIALKILSCKYDNIFNTAFPYSMGWHGAPTGEYLNTNQDHWTFHAVYYPPLLRSATVRKFMVGYEMLAQIQRDLTPERAAAIIRDQANTLQS